MKQTFLALGFGIIGSMGFAQNQPDSIHVVLHDNQNGTVRVLDTIVPLGQQQALFMWMEANGWEAPPPPPAPGAEPLQFERVIVLDRDSGALPADCRRHVVVVHQPCDSMPRHAMKVRSGPHGPAPRDASGNVMIVRGPMPPHAPGSQVEVDVVHKDTIIGGKTRTMIIRTERVILPEGVSAPPVPPQAPGAPVPPAPPRGMRNAGENQKQLSVYPNPSTDIITAEFDVKAKEKTTLRVIDMNGKQVYSEVIVDDAGKHVVREINLAGNPKGAYTVEVESAGKIIAQKIVLQ